MTEETTPTNGYPPQSGAQQAWGAQVPPAPPGGYQTSQGDPRAPQGTYQSPTPGQAAPEGGYQVPPGAYAAAGGYAPQGTAYPPTAPTPTGPTPLGHQMRWMLAPQGLLTVALIAAVTFGIGLVSGVLWAATLVTAAGGYTDGMFFSLMMVFTGASLGGGLSATSDFGSGSLVFFSLGTLMAVVIGIVFVLRRRAYVDGTITETMPTAVRALCEGAAVALVSTLLTAFFKVADYFHSQAALTFLILLVVVAGADFVGRQRVAGTQWVPTVLRQPLRELWGGHKLWFVVFGVVALVLIFVAVVAEDSNGMVSTVPMLMLIPMLLPNAVIWVIGLAHFGGISVSGSSFLEDSPSHANLMAWNLASGWGTLLIVLALLCVVAGSVAVGVRRERTSAPVWSRTWQMPVLGLVFWIVVGVFFSGVRGSASIASAIDGLGGVTLSGWTPICVTIALFAMSALAEVTPAYFAVNAPGLLSFIGGPRTSAAWLASPVRQIAPRVHVPAAPPAQGPQGVPGPFAQASPYPPVQQVPQVPQASSYPPVQQVPQVPQASSYPPVQQVPQVPQASPHPPAQPGAYPPPQSPVWPGGPVPPPPAGGTTPTAGTWAPSMPPVPPAPSGSGDAGTDEPGAGGTPQQ